MAGMVEVAIGSKYIERLQPLEVSAMEYHQFTKATKIVINYQTLSSQLQEIERLLKPAYTYTSHEIIGLLSIMLPDMDEPESLHLIRVLCQGIKEIQRARLGALRDLGFSETATEALVKECLPSSDE